MIILVDSLSGKLTSTTPDVSLPICGREPVAVLMPTPDMAWAALGTSNTFVARVSVAESVIAEVTLTASTWQLTGNLNTNTVQAIAKLSAKGYPQTMDGVITILEQDGNQNCQRVIGSVKCSLVYSPSSGVVTTLSQVTRASVALTDGVGTVSVTFATPLTSSPTYVGANVSAPAGQDAIFVASVSSISTTGFTVTLSAAPSVSGYTLAYLVVV